MKRIILAVVTALACNAALAADPAMYVSASAGYAEQKLSADGIGGSISDNDTGFQAAFGYRFAPNFGAEVGYTSFGKASISDGNETASAKPESFYGALTGTYTISPQFSLTGKLGVARNSTKLSATGLGSEKLKQTSAVFGIGASYAVTGNTAIIAEYQNFGKIIDEDGANLKAQIVTVGVRYSF